MPELNIARLVIGIWALAISLRNLQTSRSDAAWVREQGLNGTRTTVVMGMVRSEFVRTLLAVALIVLSVGSLWGPTAWPGQTFGILVGLGIGMCGWLDRRDRKHLLQRRKDDDNQAQQNKW